MFIVPSRDDMSIYRAQILKMDTNEDMEGNS